MVEAMSDDEEVAGMVLDSIAAVKDLIGPEKGEEVLQARIVSQAEVRRSIEEWRPSIEKELSSLLRQKGLCGRSLLKNPCCQIPQLQNPTILVPRFSEQKKRPRGTLK